MKLILQAVDDPRLRMDFVWTPIWPTSGLNAALSTMPTSPDPRARVWFDATRQLSKGLSRFMEDYDPIWDVYLIYGPGASWHDLSDTPGAPDYVEHQMQAIFKAGWTYLNKVTFQSAVESRLEAACGP